MKQKWHKNKDYNKNLPLENTVVILSSILKWQNKKALDEILHTLS